MSESEPESGERPRSAQENLQLDAHMHQHNFTPTTGQRPHPTTQGEPTEGSGRWSRGFAVLPPTPSHPREKRSSWTLFPCGFSFLRLDMAQAYISRADMPQGHFGEAMAQRQVTIGAPGGQPMCYPLGSTNLRHSVEFARVPIAGRSPNHLPPRWVEPQNHGWQGLMCHNNKKYEVSTPRTG